MTSKQISYLDQDKIIKAFVNEKKLFIKKQSQPEVAAYKRLKELNVDSYLINNAVIISYNIVFIPVIGLLSNDNI